MMIKDVRIYYKGELVLISGNCQFIDIYQWVWEEKEDNNIDNIDSDDIQIEFTFSGNISELLSVENGLKKFKEYITS